MFDWTDDNIATLRFMWLSGASLRSIAQALGTTRSSISGKARRLNLPRHQSAAPEIANSQRPLTPPSRTRECQWVHGDPRDQSFCGEATRNGTSYCDRHVRVVYRVPPKSYRGDRSWVEVRHGE